MEGTVGDGLLGDIRELLDLMHELRGSGSMAELAEHYVMPRASG